MAEGVGLHFNDLVLAAREEVVSARHKLHCHHVVLVREHALVAVPEIQPPDLDVLVRGSRDQER